MRSSIAASLMLLLILISEARGIRLLKENMSSGHTKIHEGNEGSGTKRNSESVVVEVNDLCKSGECSGRKNRKPFSPTTYTPATSTTSPKRNKGRSKSYLDEEADHVGANLSGSSDDLMVITGTDYAPARGTPPIHN